MVHNYTVPSPARRLDPLAVAVLQSWHAPSVQPRTLAARGAPGVNKQEFTGILCTLDEPSDKPPGGAQGRRVVLPSAVVRTKLASLVNMPLNASQDLTDHDRHTVVGVVQDAWIAGPRLMIAGLLYDKNEGPLVARMQANTSQLGLSYEISSCVVVDEAAPIWVLRDFEFTGCSALLRSHAAYQSSAIEAAAAQR